MRISWFKSAIALGAVVMVAGVSVPVSVSASTATQSQKIQNNKVSQSQVAELQQKVSDLTPDSIQSKVNQTSDAQVHKDAVKATSQLKSAITDSKIKNKIKSVSLSDLKSSATTTAITNVKQAWDAKAASAVQNQLKHASTADGFTQTQVAQLHSMDVEQAIKQLTPEQFKLTLNSLTETQWQQMLGNAFQKNNMATQKVTAPAADNIKKATQSITDSQVSKIKKAVANTENSNYFTDILNNPDQIEIKANLTSSLLGLLIPLVSIALKLGFGPTMGLMVDKGIDLIYDIMIPVLMVMLFPLLAALWVITSIIGLVPILGLLPMLVIHTELLIMFPLVKFFASLQGYIMYGGIATIIGFLISLLFPILPPILTLPQIGIGPRNDQTITYADSLKSGHQYTQAINVKAGHSYQVSFKSDQAADIEANDPMTSFGTLSYGLVADKAAAIGKSDVSDYVSNVKNGTGTISSRATLNSVITFDAQKTGTIYLVADTAKATVNSRQSKDNYSSIPLWYVNSSIDTTLN